MLSANRQRLVLPMLYWVATIAALGIGVGGAITVQGESPAGGPAGLLFIHLPVAVNTFLAALVVCVAGVGYLSGRRLRWDDLAESAATVTVLNGTVLLLTGVIWAKSAWGLWWTWSPRLAFSLVLWLLYAVYLAARSRMRPGHPRALVCAVYGVVAFLDVPLLYLTAKMLPDVHPAAAGLPPGTAGLMWVCMIGTTMLTAGNIALRFRLAAERRGAGEAQGPPTSLRGWGEPA